MLDFTPSEVLDEKQTRTTQVRHGDRLVAMIEQAARSLAVDKSVFVRAAILKEAERVLEAGSRHVMSRRDAELFAAALDQSPDPTPRAREAAKAYRSRIVHAD